MSSLFTKIIIKENAHKTLKGNVPSISKKINNMNGGNNQINLSKKKVKRVDWTTSKEKRLGFKKSWV